MEEGGWGLRLGGGDRSVSIRGPGEEKRVECSKREGGRDVISVVANLEDATLKINTGLGRRETDHRSTMQAHKRRATLAFVDFNDRKK